VAVAASVVLVVVAVCRQRRPPVVVAVPAVVVALAGGFARLLLGVHHPSDVVGGYLLGVAWTAAACWLVRPRRPVVPAGPRPAGSAVAGPADRVVASAQAVQPDPELRGRLGVAGQHRQHAGGEFDLPDGAQHGEAGPLGDVE